MKVFVVDNYDSFTYNLVHILEIYADQVIVKRNDEIMMDELEEMDKIVFSPGPGLPTEVPVMYKIVEKFQSTKAILGICLGLQAITEFYGGKIYNMDSVDHGIGKYTTVIYEDPIFNDIPKEFISGRYHSWAVKPEYLPTDLVATAIDNKGDIMGIKHNEFNVKGLQFHPESILTLYGENILKNWVLG